VTPYTTLHNSHVVTFKLTAVSHTASTLFHILLDAIQFITYLNQRQTWHMIASFKKQFNQLIDHGISRNNEL